MSEMRAFGSLEDFLFEAPMYEKVKLPETEVEMASVAKQPLDGYCPSCGEQSLFTRRGDLPIGAQWQQHRGPHQTSLVCARNETHRLYFQMFFENGSVQKIGQYPTYATVAQGYIKAHRKLLNKQDGAELTKAIGLRRMTLL